MKLRDRRTRERAARFLVEGKRELMHAFEAGWELDHLFVTEAARADDFAGRVAERGGRVIEVTGDVFAKIAVRDDRDGWLGVFVAPDLAADRLRLPAEPLVLATLGVEKPGNLGALLRSADAFGADALIVEGGTDLLNPNVVRSSLGCLFTVPVGVAPAGTLLAWLRGRGLRIVAATPDGTAPPDRTDFSGAVAIVVGAEAAGLPADSRGAADSRVRIPMRGRADSLNVSVAAAVLLYEADRQRAR
ncbi:MAG: RNA methyltransferase [bacterium]